MSAPGTGPAFRGLDATVVDVFTRLLDDGNLDVLALRDAPGAVVR